MVAAIPENYPRVSPHLTVDGATEAIAYYSEVFGATQRGDLFTMPDGSVGHAELQIGDSVIMLADENPQFGNKGPRTVGGTPVTIMIYVADADATVELAQRKGATVDQPVSDQFYGDRVGVVTDPFGHIWHIATHVEDVTSEEMARRSAEMFAS
ncbi:VOC family protein [Haloechinothrix sp. LS1_15]|uniref:VOC family protein n=1 Tax=Haloechinothrix sp. LS1_15 TaxID=2652248 RepID=UPI002944FABD|nr:VOC family protein [Haloechinothrix sp. LS1_15]MDV6011709.1 VOC family protein [Haloechinothrix sp. LS1_15]